MEDRPQSEIAVTLIRLGFLKVVFSGRGGLLDNPFKVS